MQARYDLQTKDVYDVMKRSTWDCFVCRNICVCRLCRDKSLANVFGKSKLTEHELPQKKKKSTRLQGLISLKLPIAEIKVKIRAKIRRKRQFQKKRRSQKLKKRSKEKKLL